MASLPGDTLQTMQRIIKHCVNYSMLWLGALSALQYTYACCRGRRRRRSASISDIRLTSVPSSGCTRASCSGLQKSSFAVLMLTVTSPGNGPLRGYAFSCCCRDVKETPWRRRRLHCPVGLGHTLLRFKCACEHEVLEDIDRASRLSDAWDACTSLVFCRAWWVTCQKNTIICRRSAFDFLGCAEPHARQGTMAHCSCL